MFELIDVNDLASLAKIIGGNLTGENKQFRYITTDSRKINQNSLFLALLGEKYDGHDFCETAIKAGAQAYISTKEIINHSGIVVEDTYLALMKMARYQQQQVNPKTLAITGSNGKTTLKEMVAHILDGHESIKTKDNENNQFGIPFTVLRLKRETRFLVLECGARKLGDFDLISEYLKFDVLVITNINNSHIEIFENQTNIIKTKTKLLDGLTEGGSFIDGAFEDWGTSDKLMEINQTFRVNVHHNLEQDSETKPLTENWNCTVVSGQQEGSLPGFFGLSFQQTLSSSSKRFQSPKKMNLGPMHNCHNVLLAILAARELGVQYSESIKRMCEFKTPLPNRYFIEHIGQHVLINDTYNANPSSFQAVAESAAAMYPGRRKIAVVGRMAELGVNSPELHRQVGAMLAASGFEQLLAFGEDDSRYYAEGWRTVQNFPGVPCQFVTLDALVAAFPQLQNPGDVVLVKGSRSAGMERFVQQVAEP